MITRSVAPLQWSLDNEKVTNDKAGIGMIGLTTLVIAAVISSNYNYRDHGDLTRDNFQSIHANI